MEKIEAPIVNFDLPLNIKEAKEFLLDQQSAIFLDHLRIVFNEKTNEKHEVLLPTTLNLEKNKIYLLLVTLELEKQL